MISDEYLTPEEVAAILKVHPRTVKRRFAKVPGVVNLGSEETRTRSPYRILRIPREVLDRFLLDHQNRNKR